MVSRVIIASLLIAGWLGGEGYALAVDGGDSSQTSSASSSAKPQPDAAKKSSSSSSDQQKQPQKPAGSEAEENPFPEAVSRRAAESKDQAEPPSAPSPSQPASVPNSGANPFPEAVSRKAAAAAKKQQQPAGPAYSSSQSSSALSSPAPGSATPPDPARAKKDIQVGNYYMDSGDYRGAYLRFEDAVKYNPADLAAIFGLADSARKVGKYDEAARNYRIYLAVAPHGGKAKAAKKALREMAGK